MDSSSKSKKLIKVEEFRKNRRYDAAKLLSFSGDATANLTNIDQPFKYNATGMNYHILTKDHDKAYIQGVVDAEAAADVTTADKKKTKSPVSPTTQVHFITQAQLKAGASYLTANITPSVQWDAFLPLLKAQNFTAKADTFATILDTTNTTPVVLAGLGDVIDGLTADVEAEHLSLSAFRSTVHGVAKHIKQHLPTTKNISMHLPALHLTTKRKHPFGAGNGVKDKDDDEDDDEEDDKEDDATKPAVPNVAPEDAAHRVDHISTISAALTQVTQVNHVFDKFFSPTNAKEKNPTHFKNLFITTPHPVSAELYQLSRNAINMAESVVLTREIGNEPSNLYGPAQVEEHCKLLQDAHPKALKLSMLSHQDLLNKGYNLAASVGEGSEKSQQTRIAAFQYVGGVDGEKPAAATDDKTKKTLAVVGKTVTFDTGGLCIKPAEYMLGMKYDKMGGITALGVMRTLALNQPPLSHNVVGVMGIVENSVGSRATHPGAIITEQDGSTTMVTDTDAEGRLLLASALLYAQNEYKAQELVSVATLTGSVCGTLGASAAGAFTNNFDLAQKIQKVGLTHDEPYWHLPIFPVNYKKTSGTQTDYQNCTVESGVDASNAAAYLTQFIQKKNSLLHLDIAGMADGSEENGLLPSGATGFGVTSIYKYVVDDKY